MWRVQDDYGCEWDKLLSASSCSACGHAPEAPEPENDVLRMFPCDSSPSNRPLKKKERKSTRPRDHRRDEACYFQITQRNKRSLDDPCRPEKQSVRKSETAPPSVTFTLSGRIKISAVAAGNLALKNGFLVPVTPAVSARSHGSTCYPLRTQLGRSVIPSQTNPLLKAVAEQEVKCKFASQIQREQQWAGTRQPGGGESWTQEEGRSRRRDVDDNPGRSNREAKLSESSS